MPENSSTVAPSDVRMVKSLTKKTSDLAFLTVALVNEGKPEEAKEPAKLCAEGLDILRVYFAVLPPADAAAIAGEVRRQNQKDAESRIQ